MSNIRKFLQVGTVGALIASGGPVSNVESKARVGATAPGCELKLRDASKNTEKPGVVEGEMRGRFLPTSYNPDMWVKLEIGGREVRMPGILGSDGLQECIREANGTGILRMALESGNPEVHQKLREDLHTNGLNKGVVVDIRVEESDARIEQENNPEERR